MIDIRRKIKLPDSTTIQYAEYSSFNKSIDISIAGDGNPPCYQPGSDAKANNGN
jgi:hypothetical protein